MTRGQKKNLIDLFSFVLFYSRNVSNVFEKETLDHPSPRNPLIQNNSQTNFFYEISLLKIYAEDHTCMGLFLASLQCSVDLCVLFMLYCIFVIQFEIRNCDTSSCLLLSQYFPGCLESCVFPCEFQDSEVFCKSNLCYFF